jgi:hypothetical protein
MSTAEQYHAKAAEYRALLGNPLSPSETKEFRALEQTFTTRLLWRICGWLPPDARGVRRELGMAGSFLMHHRACCLLLL